MYKGSWFFFLSKLADIEKLFWGLMKQLPYSPFWLYWTKRPKNLALSEKCLTTFETLNRAFEEEKITIINAMRANLCLHNLLQSCVLLFFRLHDPMYPWLHDPMYPLPPWLHDYMTTWLHDYTDQWVGWTTDTYLSMVTDTVDRMEPFRDIWTRSLTVPKTWDIH